MENQILGLRTVVYKVADINKAKEWYTKAFGQSPYFDEPYYVGFNVAGYELGLQPEDEELTGKAENVITYWGVADITEEYNRFLSLGAEAHGAPENVGGELMVATIKDLWGNVIGLIYNPYFKL